GPPFIDWPMFLRLLFIAVLLICSGLCDVVGNADTRMVKRDVEPTGMRYERQALDTFVTGDFPFFLEPNKFLDKFGGGRNRK
ncbi:hypothetical protein PMAYCL1PPCAC_26836, partial [Pristionchus mayeri]